MHWSDFANMAKQVAGNPNLTQWQFLNNPALQEKTMDYYFKNELIPQVATLRKQYPQQTKGLSDEQIMATIHHRGYPNANQIFAGKADPNDVADTNNYLAKL